LGTKIRHKFFPEFPVMFIKLMGYLQNAGCISFEKSARKKDSTKKNYIELLHLKVDMCKVFKLRHKNECGEGKVDSDFWINTSGAFIHLLQEIDPEFQENLKNALRRNKDSSWNSAQCRLPKPVQCWLL